MKTRTYAVERIIVHHSLTDDSHTLSWGAIRVGHLSNGWSDIGYHAGAEMVRGGVECLYGRPDNFDGAHTRGQNDRSLGFCFVGNFDKYEPSDGLIETAAQRVIAPWVLTHKLSPCDIVPHRDFANKSCPGELFDVDRLRNVVAWIMDSN